MRRHILIFVLVLVLSASLAEAKDAVMAYRSSVQGGTCNSNPTAPQCPRVRFWNSTGTGTWEPEIALPTSGSNLQHLIIRSSPVMNKLVIISMSNDNNLDAYVCTVNCSYSTSWVVTNDIGLVNAVGSTRRFDFQYEPATGDLILVYAVNSADSTRDLAYKILPANQTSFSGITEQYLDDTSQSSDVLYSWLVMDRSKQSSSREALLTGIDNTNGNINAWVWNGSTFANEVKISTGAVTNNDPEQLAVRYSFGSNLGMVLGSNGSAGDMVYRYWDGSVWSSPAIFTAGSNTLGWTALKADPSSDYLQAVIFNDNKDLYTAFWNGSQWNVSSIGSGYSGAGSTRPADFEWEDENSAGLLTWGQNSNQLRYMKCAPICNGSVTTDSGYSVNTRYLALSRNPSPADYVKILGLRINNQGNGQLGSFSWNGTALFNYGNTAITPGTGTQNVEIAFSIEPSAYYDNVPPVVHLVSPANDSVINASSNFTFNVTDDVAAVLECDIYIDSVLQQTNYSIANGSTSQFEISGLTDGQHSWRVDCVDQGNNTGVSETWIFTVEVENCPIIPAAGTYTMNGNYIGAPRLAAPLSGNACVKITASNVVFDCNGHTITGNGTVVATTYGILLNGSLTNVTVKNCAAVSNYSYGVYIYQSNDSFFDNNTAFNNSISGVSVFSSSNIRLTNNNVSNNALDGIVLNLSNDTLVQGNLIYLNQQNGVILLSSLRNNITENAVYNDSTGFALDIGSDFNNLTNNSAYNNLFYGFQIISSSSNLIFANDAYDEGSGFVFASGSSNNTVTSNSAYNNVGDGFLLDACSNNNLSANAAYNNGATGFNLHTSSSDNVLFNNSAFNNAQHGFYLYLSCDSNILTANTAYDNSETGLYIADSNLTQASANHLYGNPRDLVLNSTSSPFLVYLTNNIFDNPSDSNVNFTDLSINDTVEASVSFATAYSITWSPQPPGLASSYTSLGGKFINISAMTGLLSISTSLWHWTDGEADAAEPNLVLARYDGTWNYTLNTTPDTLANTLGLSDVASDGVYAILIASGVPPAVYPVSPANNSFLNSSTVVSTFYFVDDFSATSNCSIYVDGSLSQTNESTLNDTNTSFTLPSLSEATHGWYVNCTDGDGKSNVSETWEFTVDLTAPSLTVESPTGAPPYSTPTVPLDYTTSATNCSYSLDGGIPVQLPDCFNITLPSLGSGSHNVTVIVNDTAGNTNSSTVYFIVDKIGRAHV